MKREEEIGEEGEMEEIIDMQISGVKTLHIQ